MWGSFQDCKNGLNLKSINIICHINRPKKKNHTQLYQLMQKIYLKLAQYPFMKKTLNKVRIEGKLFKLIKGIYKNKQKNP